MLRAGRWAVTAALAAAILTGARLDAAAAQQRPLIDVPYLPQTEQLCGGAAAAMVMRYWGDREIRPERFAGLVDPATKGIHTTALAEFVRERGWQAVASAAPAEQPLSPVINQLTQGRPVIALLEERPNVYHYVVVIGATDAEVIVHDPARRPHRILAVADFTRRWNAAERWMLVILPPAGGVANVAGSATTPDASVAPDIAPPDTPPADSPCAALVAQGVALGRANKRDEAEQVLVAATTQCPGEASGWGELAGLRFVEHRYPDATRLAAHALTLAPDDANARSVLATALYLQGHLVEALAAWNEAGRPRVDLISIEGLERMDYPLAIERLGLRPGDMLTPNVFVRAERRLEALPSASSSALTYAPDAGGRANVEATIKERSLLPKGAIGWALVGLRSAFLREVSLDIAGLTGQGDVSSPAYRWSANRPRVRGVFEMPAPGRLPGIVTLDAFWERQSYAPPTPGAPVIREERRRGAVQFSDWAAGWLRWTAGAAADRIVDRAFVSARGELNTRWLDDRVWARAAGERWGATDGGAGFSSGETSIAWRSTSREAAPVLSSVLGFTAASDQAPLAVWAVAGSSSSRGALARGHTLFDDGVITSPLLGRRLLFASAEYRRPAYQSPQGQLDVAAFIDLARAWQRLDPTTTNAQVDAGLGVRIGSPLTGSAIRLDVGVGLRDGHFKLSAGYVVPWGQ
jgi:hypothetical protein